MGASAAGRLLADFRRFAGVRLVLLLLLMAGGALAEGFGIVMLIPLLALAGNGGEVPAILQPMLQLVPRSPDFPWTAALLILFLLIMALRSLLIYGRDVTIARLDAQYTANMRLRSASALAEGGWKQASRLGLSGMQSLLLTEIPRCVLAAHQAQTAGVALLMLIVQFTLAFLLSPALAGTALLIVAAALAASLLLLRQGRRRGIAISAHGEQSSAAGYRLHAGLKAALAQGSVPAFLDQYGRSLDSLSRESWGFSQDWARTRAMASFGAAFAAVILIVIGQQSLQLPFAVLATLLVLFARMSGPAQSLQQSLHGLAAHATAFDALERGVGSLRPRAIEAGAALEPIEWRQLRLESVAYAHPDSGFVLRVPELTLSAGEWLGIGGSSGGGKTSLVDIAVGLLAPDQGEVLVDGQPLDSAMLARWRSGIAYVAQNEQPFEGTLRENLLAGSGEPRSDESLWAALDAVGLAERVRATDAGLDMPLGDRGSALSGGERQRLAIARALLRRPSLLVLDEATNALDPESEIRLLQRLREIAPRASLILIAHRTAPLDLCDRVVTVDGGRLA
jgi:ATP-binding cassette subfamily C protein